MVSRTVASKAPLLPENWSGWLGSTDGPARTAARGHRPFMGVDLLWADP